MKHRRLQSIGRREFIKSSALAGLGVGLGLAEVASASISATPAVRRYTPLGRTGIKISDISFGSGRLSTGDEDLVCYAVNLGINYFDTAENYRGGESETVLGNALRGNRKKVFLTSKTLAWPNTEPVERRWNATQKSQSLEHKPTSAPTTGSGANTRCSLSPRAEVSDGLMRRYPWVASEHPQNPQQRFYQQQAEGLTRELKVRNPPPPLERDLRIIEG